MSYCKFLAKVYGGKWKYSYPCYWHCDDDKRYIARVSNGVDEWDNPIGGRGTRWLYGDGTPRRAALRETHGTIFGDIW
jgi:hypothetical protein